MNSAGPAGGARTTAAAGIVAAVVASLLAFAAGAHAQGEAPWRAAEQVRSGLFEAQSSMLLGDGDDAEALVAGAQRAVAAELARGLARRAPADLRALEADLAAAAEAADRGDEVALAAARGRAVAALRRGAYAVTLAAARRGDVAEARRWLLIRDFRQATRFTRPGVDATASLADLAAGEIEPGAAVTGIKKDLLDAYQTRLLGYLDAAEQAAQRGFDAALAENAALAAGYWRILAAEYERQRGVEERAGADRSFAELAAASRAGEGAEFRSALTDSREALDGFTAAPFTPEEQARRAAQLIRFLDLVPIEYDDGTDDGHVTIAFELQEAVAFTEGAESALNDLESTLAERDPAGVETIEAALAELERYSRAAHEGGQVVPLEEVEAAHDRASDALDATLPEEWKETDTEADFDLIDISLDQMQAAISAGEWDQAEQARLSAYGFFEFGPEPLLRALDPQLVAEVEGLVWYGARDVNGLGELIANRASIQDVRETRVELDEALDQARGVTGEGASDATMITNAAVIVFREGLEAILIIAAITASMVAANRPLRKPIYRGALLALPASAVLWVLAQTVIDSFSRYGEKLEAVVGLIAIAVLLLVLNWFFHRVYWTAWIAGHRKRGKAIVGTAAAAGVAGATIASLYLLGFSSVFREGFETVLFLQALDIEAGTGVVLAGVGLGLVLTAAVGALTFLLERRLPYKRMLVVTGVLIALVLVVLVGNTVRTMQGVGWVPITPLDVEFPLWMGTWLGVFPTVETLAAQALAFGFVVGSYLLTEWVRKRHLRQAIAAHEAEFERAGSESATPVHARGAGAEEERRSVAPQL